MKKNQSPLVSVIIPTYNRANLVQKAISSVLQQTYQNFEIIVVDDGSSDNTADVVTAFKDPRITYIWQKNSGMPAPPRNAGLSRARGEFIAFLDSDDLWLPQKVEKQLFFFTQNPDLLGVCTNGMFFPHPNTPIWQLRKNEIVSFARLVKENLFLNSGMMIRRVVIDAIGVLDEDKRLKAAEDYDYWLRILHYKDNSLMRTKDICIKFRIHRENLSDYALGSRSRDSEVLKHQIAYDIANYWRVKAIYAKYKDEIPELVELSLRNFLRDIQLNKIKWHILIKDMGFAAFLKDKNVPITERLRLARNFLKISIKKRINQIFNRF